MRFEISTDASKLVFVGSECNYQWTRVCSVNNFIVLKTIN